MNNGYRIAPWADAVYAMDAAWWVHHLAEVVSTFTGTDTTGQGAQTIITVDVPSGDAAQLAAMAASGKVAVVLDSRDR